MLVNTSGQRDLGDTAYRTQLSDRETKGNGVDLETRMPTPNSTAWVVDAPSLHCSHTASSFIVVWMRNVPHLGCVIEYFFSSWHLWGKVMECQGDRVLWEEVSISLGTDWVLLPGLTSCSLSFSDSCVQRKWDLSASWLPGRLPPPGVMPSWNNELSGTLNQNKPSFL